MTDSILIDLINISSFFSDNLNKLKSYDEKINDGVVFTITDMSKINSTSSYYNEANYPVID